MSIKKNALGVACGLALAAAALTPAIAFASEPGDMTPDNNITDIKGTEGKTEIVLQKASVIDNDQLAVQVPTKITLSVKGDGSMTYGTKMMAPTDAVITNLSNVDIKVLPSFTTYTDMAPGVVEAKQPLTLVSAPGSDGSWMKNPGSFWLKVSGHDLSSIPSWETSDWIIKAGAHLMPTTGGTECEYKLAFEGELYGGKDFDNRKLGTINWKFCAIG